MTEMIPGPLQYIDLFKRPEQHRIRVELLRKAGCECERPYIEWHPIEDAPRCINCGTVAKE